MEYFREFHRVIAPVVVLKRMNKFVILPLILVGCTAPVTDPPAHAFELEIEESQWQYVYDAIEYIKRGEREKK